MCARTYRQERSFAFGTKAKIDKYAVGSYRNYPQKHSLKLKLYVWDLGVEVKHEVQNFSWGPCLRS